MKFIRFFIFALLISTPLLAQTSAGGGSNPPAPKGCDTPGGCEGEEPVPIDDYIPLFFIVGISLGAYYMSKSQSVVK
ncbi:MAG: hypothetical protein ACPHXS_01500 [Flavobacteriaceae bacterium]